MHNCFNKLIDSIDDTVKEFSNCPSIYVLNKKMHLEDVTRPLKQPFMKRGIVFILRSGVRR
jgi:hypothetical protein